MIWDKSAYIELLGPRRLQSYSLPLPFSSLRFLQEWFSASQKWQFHGPNHILSNLNPIKSMFIVQLSNLFEKYILVRPSISPQYTSRISVSGVQENWRIGVKIWKGLVLWSGLMGTFFFGGILFLRMVFFGSKFRSAKLRIRLLSTSLNSPRSQARQASARFCMFAHCLAMRRGRE